MGITYDLTQTTPTEFKKGDIINIPYSGAAKSITLPKGIYKLEVWGGQGGSYNSYTGGRGGYSYGLLSIEEDTLLYCYVGGQPATNSTNRTTTSGGFNGGGNGYNRWYSGTYTYGQGGGGATDFRIATDSLYARVIVAGGGGGSASVDAATTKYGGGISGGSPQSGYGASQTGSGTNGSFGTGGSATTSGSNYKYGSGGGGGGWYGGGANSDYSDSNSEYRGYNGGGSGYVYTSSTASNYPSGCKLNAAYYLTDAATIAGNTTFSSPSGTSETGHTGNGYARITVVKMNLSLKVKTDTEWKDASDIWCKRRETLTPVTYIQSTGTQYIDTGLKPNQNTRIVVDMDVTASSVESSLFGARNSYQNNGFALHTGSSNAGYQIDYATNTNKVTTITSSGRHKIDFNGNILTVDDTVINTYSEAAFQCNYTALIFSVHSGDTLMHENYPTTAKLYSCKIYDNNTLVRDFVPCVNDSGVGCLYDKVNQVCYYKNGTGDFIVGSTKRELPDGFTQVEYIESTGTQYIDTGFKPNQDTKVVIDALYTQDSNASFLFGSDAGSATKSFGFGAANGNLRIAYNNVSTYFANGLSFANKIHVVVDKNVATINNQYSVSGTYATFEPNYSIWLFGNNRQDTLYGGKNGTRIYACKIYHNGSLVRDYVPAITTSGTQTIIGMYDFVSRYLYTNAGTGTFQYGNAVNINEDIITSSKWVKSVNVYKKQSDMVTPVTYIEGTGTQYIDTGFKPNQDTRVVIDIDIGTQNSYPTALLGGRNGDEASESSFVIFVVSASHFRTDFGSETVDIDASTSGRFLIDKNKTICTVNGTTYTNSVATFQSNYTLAILTENDIGGYDTRITKGKIYSCKIYDNDILVRDYIPVLDSNNTPCLLDKVAGQLYYNKGTGDFQYGTTSAAIKREYWVQIF